MGLIKFQRKDRDKITFRGKTYESLSALARAHRTNPTLFIRRIKSPKYKYEFTIAEALGLKKITGKGFTKPVILEKKEFKSLTAAAKHYGLKLKTISERLLKGCYWVSRAFSTRRYPAHTRFYTDASFGRSTWSAISGICGASSAARSRPVRSWRSSRTSW